MSTEPPLTPDDEACCVATGPTPGPQAVPAGGPTAAPARPVLDLFKLLTPAEAYARLEAYLPREPRTEDIATEAAVGRILAEDLRAPAALPAFPRSTMDGFAVRAADTHGASESLPAYLHVRGEVLMGRAADVRVGAGDAVRIATGGMMPPGADAVVIVENTQEVDGHTVEVVRAVAGGENVIQVGEDVTAGEELLGRGHVLRAQDVGGLLALGLTRVRVVAPLTVGILGSGDEVVPPDQEPGPGQVRDINSYTLASLVRRAGHRARLFGVVPDVEETLQAAARAALRESDVLILSAGSSVSTRDLTARVIAALGAPGILVHGVALRPGKPTILAMAGPKPVFGLPGNPVSCIVTFDLFVAPALARMSGQTPRPAGDTVAARLTRNIASMAGREDHVPVRLERRDGGYLAHPVFGKSNLIYTLVKSEGLVTVALDKGGLREGELVEVRIL
jgi:molybdopterin molybdotransferase